MKRALLLAGGIGRKYNHIRYRNDLAAFCKALVDQGFERSSIRIHYSMGGYYDFDGDGQSEKYTSARHGVVKESLKWLGDSGENDLVVLVVSNHGASNGACLWRPGAFLTPLEVERALERCLATKVMVFGQCCAGVFASLPLTRLVVCCACGSTERSKKCAPIGNSGLSPEYDEFLYHFVAAITGAYPDGRPLVTSLPVAKAVSIGAAFRYAEANDLQPETPKMVDTNGIADILLLSS